jgi:uncharacterized damage-inducible protein DinB
MYPTLESRDDILKMLDELTEKRTQILAACDQLSPAQLGDPVYPGTWSLLQNLAHLAWAEAWMLAWIKKRPGEVTAAEWGQAPWPGDLSLSLPSVKTAFDEAHAAVIAFLKSNPESVLNEKCLYGRAKSQQTVGGVLFHLIEHEIHHRGFVLHKLQKLQGK